MLFDGYKKALPCSLTAWPGLGGSTLYYVSKSNKAKPSVSGKGLSLLMPHCAVPRTVLKRWDSAFFSAQGLPLQDRPTRAGPGAGTVSNIKTSLNGFFVWCFGGVSNPRQCQKSKCLSQSRPFFCPNMATFCGDYSTPPNMKIQHTPAWAAKRQHIICRSIPGRHTQHAENKLFWPQKPKNQQRKKISCWTQRFLWLGCQTAENAQQAYQGCSPMTSVIVCSSKAAYGHNKRIGFCKGKTGRKRGWIPLQAAPFKKRAPRFSDTHTTGHRCATWTVWAAPLSVVTVQTKITGDENYGENRLREKYYGKI